MKTRGVCLIVGAFLISSAISGCDVKVSKPYDSNDSVKKLQEIEIESAVKTDENNAEKSSKSATTLDYIIVGEKIRWDMASEEVRDVETRELDDLYSIEKGNSIYLSYLPNSESDKYSDEVRSNYCFIDNQLKAYWCTFDSKKIYSYKEMYQMIKDRVSQTYGECESENVQWTDEMYENDESKWDDAFRYGYVTIKTSWHTENAAIIINWDYHKGMSVVTSALDFEDRL